MLLHSEVERKSLPHPERPDRLRAIAAILATAGVLYISLHRHEGGKFYPGTGVAHEVGSMGGEGYCVNVPWSRGGIGDHSHRIRQSSHDPRSKRLDPKRGTIAYRSPTETPSGTSCLRSHQFFKSIPET
ncbi:hypothetical protein Lser_V15G35650 [Lactuca serriola]